jgi:hypothetical protein
VKALKGWPITRRGDITELMPEDEFRKKVEDLIAKTTRTPASARKFLTQAGILDKSGKLVKHLR